MATQSIPAKIVLLGNSGIFNHFPSTFFFPSRVILGGFFELTLCIVCATQELERRVLATVLYMELSRLTMQPQSELPSCLKAC